MHQLTKFFLIKKFRKVTLRKEGLNESNKYTCIFTRECTTTNLSGNARTRS